LLTIELAIEQYLQLLVSTCYTSILRVISVTEHFLPNMLRYDSVVNTYLIEECGLRPPSSPQYGLVVHSHSDFFGSIAFPAVAELALRVNKLGKSSVTYEIALFERGIDEAKSVGEIIHVFVDRDTGRPATKGMNDDLKAGLQRILIQQSKL
jgi:acyl-CoA thioester hydrolase